MRNCFVRVLRKVTKQINSLGVRWAAVVPRVTLRAAKSIVRLPMHRLQRGVVYERGKAEQALQNFFRESTLVAPRELALRQTAYEVGQRMSSEEHPAEAPDELSRHPHKDQKILVLVTANPKTAMLIRRAKRMSDFVNAECFAVALQPTGDLSALPQAEREAMEKHLNFARNLHIETRLLEGEDVAVVLVDFARRNQITQIYLTRPRERKWLTPFRSDPAQKIISLARDMQIVIVSDREQMAHRTA